MLSPHSDTVREQVSIVLAGAGYEIIEAEDGLQGAALIRENPGASLAICDVNMPKLNGLEMLEFLKMKSAAMPVLMLTTEGRPDLIERARSCGASHTPPWHRPDRAGPAQRLHLPEGVVRSASARRYVPSVSSSR